MPLVLSEYPLLILCYVLVFALACLGLNLLFGTTGLLSLGHAAYFGIGGYAGAFLCRFSNLESLEFHLLAGILAATLLATAFGFLCTRTTKIHFAILSLALAQIVHSLFIDGAVFELFGGVGRALRAIRDIEQRANFIGIPVRRYRWFAFVVSAAFVALAGGLTRPTHYGSRAQCPGVIYALICRRSRKLNHDRLWLDSEVRTMLPARPLIP